MKFKSARDMTLMIRTEDRRNYQLKPSDIYGDVPMVVRKTIDFQSAVRKGHIRCATELTNDEIDEKVGEWHKTPGDNHVYDYLGWTEAEYAVWVELKVETGLGREG